MGAYLQLFWDLCRWRRGPGDVPASGTLFALLVLLYWGASAVQSRIAYGPDHVAGPATLDLALTLAFFGLVFSAAGRVHRYRQAVGAVLGTSVLLTPPLLLLAVAYEPGAVADGLAVILQAATVGLIVWYLFIVGSIVRAALDCGLLAGMGVSIAYFLAGATLVATLFPHAG